MGHRSIDVPWVVYRAAHSPGLRAAALAAWMAMAACTAGNPVFRPGDAAGDQAGDGTTDGATTSEVSGPGDLRLGLVAYWKFDDAMESLTARDSSDRGHAGDLEGLDRRTAWVPGRHGFGLAFTLNDPMGAVRVRAHADFDNLQAYTLAAWTFRPMARPQSFNSIISRQAGDAQDEVFNLLFVRDQLRAYRSSTPGTGDNASVTSPNVAPLNRWVHAAVSFDGQRLRLYEDGVEVGRIDHAFRLAASSKPVYLGTNLNGSVTDRNNFVGTLDEVRVYSRALPAAAIAALASATAPVP